MAENMETWEKITTGPGFREDWFLGAHNSSEMNLLYWDLYNDVLQKDYDIR